MRCFPIETAQPERPRQTPREPGTGVGYELNVIAAVVVGGTSLTGGRGSIVGTFFGALLIGVLDNVMNLLNIESYTQ